MKLEQYKAITDYCNEEGYTSKEAFVSQLKEWGLLDERSSIEDLASAVSEDTYDTMYNYLKTLLGE